MSNITGILAGVGLLSMCCISSSLAAGAMGGEKTIEETSTSIVEAPKGPTMLKCINTQLRGDMGWTFKKRVKTEAEARALCPDSKYMSLECPTVDGFEVWCVDDISKADVLLDKECKGDVTSTPLHGGKNNHCVGPYKWGDVNGGGANRGALYEI
jgi:hypothetical protein